jgi:hypothetical protein
VAAAHPLARGYARDTVSQLPSTRSKSRLSAVSRSMTAPQETAAK